MDDKNHPVLLPNGYCYCEREIKKYTDEKKGKISDPWQMVQGMPKKNVTQFKSTESRKIYFCWEKLIIANYELFCFFV